ncbi:hypothetical protein EDB86DRAFT_2826599 [Lactarius hatsudake]|nr:hypothetical protein EDB86DRAFT_2826599 [Lactarius hatsudake]
MCVGQGVNYIGARKCLPRIILYFFVPPFGDTSDKVQSTYLFDLEKHVSVPSDTTGQKDDTVMNRISCLAISVALRCLPEYGIFSLRPSNVRTGIAHQAWRSARTEPQTRGGGPRRPTRVRTQDVTGYLVMSWNGRRLTWDYTESFESVVQWRRRSQAAEDIDSEHTSTLTGCAMHQFSAGCTMQDDAIDDDGEQILQGAQAVKYEQVGSFLAGPHHTILAFSPSVEFYLIGRRLCAIWSFTASHSWRHRGKLSLARDDSLQATHLYLLCIRIQYAAVRA